MEYTNFALHLCRQNLTYAPLKDLVIRLTNLITVVTLIRLPQANMLLVHCTNTSTPFPNSFKKSPAKSIKKKRYFRFLMYRTFGGVFYDTAVAFWIITLPYRCQNFITRTQLLGLLKKRQQAQHSLKRPRFLSRKYQVTIDTNLVTDLGSVLFAVDISGLQMDAVPITTNKKNAEILLFSFLLLCWYRSFCSRYTVISFLCHWSKCQTLFTTRTSS